MSSNVSGSSTSADLILLVSNLQSSVNAITSSFNGINNNIVSLNNYDNQNTGNINNINSKNTKQDSQITSINTVNTDQDNKINNLVSKFPITDSSVLSISKSKITDLVSNLTTINDRLDLNENQIFDLDGFYNNLDADLTVQKGRITTNVSNISGLQTLTTLHIIN